MRPSASNSSNARGTDDCRDGHRPQQPDVAVGRQRRDAHDRGAPPGDDVGDGKAIAHDRGRELAAAHERLDRREIVRGRGHEHDPTGGRSTASPISR